MSGGDARRGGGDAQVAVERQGPLLLRIGALGLWAYGSVAFLYRESVAGFQFGAVAVACVLGLGATAIFLAPGWRVVRRLVPPARMLNIGVASLSLLAAILAADLVVGMRDNVVRARAYAPMSEEVRLADPHVWHGELFPRVYYPTPMSFFLYKPNEKLTAETYGEYYNTSMLASHTLVDSVLQPRRLSYAIGPYGLRELEPLGRSRIFALGDSFVLGYSTDEGKTWTDLLGASLGEPVYNLGVSSSGPGPQLELLRYMLHTHRDSMRVQHLLWLIYEGNDLENSYATTRPAQPTRPVGFGTLLRGTVLEPLATVPDRVKRQSILRKLKDGELTLAPPRDLGRSRGRYEIDGVALPMPLYHSPRWGYMLFNPGDVEQATKPLDYLLRHPHRPLFDRTFRDMRALSQRYGFRVTVIVAPSAARLYGSAFDGFPQLSAEPYFVDYVAERARESGFGVVNLLTLLAPFAQRELLYYRDDHHWNERGNEVAAQLIEAALVSR